MLSFRPVWIEALQRVYGCSGCAWRGKLFEGLETHGLGLVCPRCFSPVGVPGGALAAREANLPAPVERRRLRAARNIPFGLARFEPRAPADTDETRIGGITPAVQRTGSSPSMI